MTQLLKQKQYNPLAAEEQVPLIFAGVNGFLDNVALDRIGEFEEAFLGHLKSNETGILDAIKTKGELSKDELEKLRKVTEEFVASF